MRLLLLFSILSFLSATPVFSQKSPVKKQTIVDLKTAIDQKMVDVRLDGLGGHQGASVKFICKNLKNRSFELLIPKGQLLMPAEESEQTLVVAEDLRLTVSPKTHAEGLLRTFCTEAGQASPNVGRSFLVGAMASAQVV
ncbi:MAG: hypothetical protein IT565_14355 [Rhodospirillales bacterium]|nr:hypothetical protein [Rhodospirillales bacterium]